MQDRCFEQSQGELQVLFSELRLTHRSTVTLTPAQKSVSILGMGSRVIEVHNRSWRNLYCGFRSTIFQCKVQRLVAGRLITLDIRTPFMIYRRAHVFEPWTSWALARLVYTRACLWRIGPCRLLANCTHGWERILFVFDDIHIRWDSGRANYKAA